MTNWVSGLRDFGVRKYGEDRFLSIDPLWEKYYAWTTYHYCGNNPVNAVDPSGMVIKYAEPNENNNEIPEEKKIHKADVNLLKLVINTVKTHSLIGALVVNTLEQMEQVVTIQPGKINDSENKLGLSHNFIKKTGNNYTFVSSEITIDIGLITTNEKKLTLTVAEELSHTFDAKKTPKQFWQNEDFDLEQGTPYHNKINEVNGKNRARQIFNQLPTDFQY